VRDVAVFIAVYLSLYVAFFLGIYTLDRSYRQFITAVEQSSLSDVDKVGCRVQELSDVTYVLFTLSFGDNLGDVLGEGRQDANNACGGLQVLTSPVLHFLSVLLSLLISGYMKMPSNKLIYTKADIPHRNEGSCLSMFNFLVWFAWLEPKPYQVPNIIIA
jgi:hypothetical protein